MSTQQCKFMYSIGRVQRAQCKLKSNQASDFCIWHDNRSKKSIPDICLRLEEILTENRDFRAEGFILKEANLRGLVLPATELIEVNFEGADLTRANLRAADLSRANFRKACLRGSDLSECRAPEANFELSLLDEADFSGANLSDSIFDLSSYRGTNFLNANLEGTILQDTSSYLSSKKALKHFMPNPFTPKAGLLPQWFGGREEARKHLAKALEQATQGYDNHLVMLGEWAFGKTALLLWLKGEAQYKDIWASYVPLPLSDDSADLKDATAALVESVSRGFSMGISSLSSFLSTVSTFGFNISGTGVSLTRKIDVQPGTLLYDTFRSLWNDLKARSRCVVLLLDDMENIKPGKQVLSALRQALTQLSVTSRAKILVVISCTPSKWDSLTGHDGHAPAGRYFSAPPVLLRSLTDAEVAEVIYKTLDGTGVSFSASLITRVQEFVAGHPYDLQIICKILYDAQHGGTVPEAAWEKSKAEADEWLKRIATKRRS